MSSVGLRDSMKVPQWTPWKTKSKAKNSSVSEIRFLKKGSVTNKSKYKNPLEIIDTIFMLVFLETQHRLCFEFCFAPYFVWIYTPNYIFILYVFSFSFSEVGVKSGIPSMYSSLLSHVSQFRYSTKFKFSKYLLSAR